MFVTVNLRLIVVLGVSCTRSVITKSGLFPDCFLLQEKSLSLKCLDVNNYDYSKCQPMFDNFKGCMAFWVDINLYQNNYLCKP